MLLAAVALVAVSCSRDDPEPAAGRQAWDANTPGAQLRGSAPARAPEGSFITSGERLGIERCPIFPRDHAFHADVSTLPVAADSAATIDAAGADLVLHPGFGSLVWQGSRPGLPINIVDSRSVPAVDVVGGKYAYLSDLSGHPIPDSPKVEGFPGAAWDRHMLIVDTATCTSHEFFYATRIPVVDKWHAATAATFDLGSNDVRDRGSTNAAGTSMLAGLLRYDEVERGRIDHTLSFSLPTIATRDPVWPASGTDGRSTDPDAPPMGTWFRLRPDADLSRLGPDARVIAQALQVHGAVLGDTGPDYIGLAGENDERWDDADLETLKTLTLDDFDVVDPSAMRVEEGSYQIR
jgi:hypothetical protein